MKFGKMCGSGRLPIYTGYAMLGAFGIGLAIGFGFG